MNITELVEHMKRHNDAVVIAGPGIGITRSTEKPSLEQLEECYTAKALRREPQKFWPFFREHIFVDPNKFGPTTSMYSLKSMVNKGYVSTIATQNTDGLFFEIGVENVIHLHGHTYHYTVGQKTYDAYSVSEQEDNVIPVDDAGKAYRPKVLLHGENYKQQDYDDLKTAIFNTHTLIVVGLDYSEEPIVNLIADFIEMKNTSNPASEDYQKKVAIAIGKAPYNLNSEIGFFEFIVDDEPAAALDRLVGALG